VAVVEKLTAEMNTLVALMIVAVALFLIMNSYRTEFFVNNKMY
jgi:hypothetical protein